MKQISKIYPYVFALFCASFPFTHLSKAIPNILLGVLGVLFCFVVKKENFKKITRLKSLYMLGLMMVIGAFSILIFQRWDDVSFITRFINIVTIVLVSLPITNSIIPIKAFVLSSLSLLLISSIRLISYSNTSGSFDFTSGEHINILLLGERPYLGIIYVACACLCWFLANKSIGITKLLWYFISSLFIAFVWIISARMALIGLFIILLGFVLYQITNIKTALAILGGILILGFLLISSNENLQKRFYFSPNKDFILSERLVHEPRYHIWECAFGMEQNTISILFGKGFEQVKSELVNCYQTRDKFYTEDQQQWFITKQFNTHNQYIEVYYAMGIIAFIFFIGFLFFSLVENRKNYFATGLVVLLLMFLFTENLIHRQVGVMLMGIIIAFITSIKFEKEEKNN